jgi:hypothetical protein
MSGFAFFVGCIFVAAAVVYSFGPPLSQAQAARFGELDARRAIAFCETLGMEAAKRDGKGTTREEYTRPCIAARILGHAE